MSLTARPSSTTLITGFGVSGAPTAHEALSDQSDASDISYSGTGTAYGQLASITDPVVHTFHVLKARVYGSSGGTGATVVHLYQGNPGSGGSSIASFTVPRTDLLGQVTVLLTSTQAAAITNYSQLYWYITKTGSHSASMTDFWFEVPNSQEQVARPNGTTTSGTLSINGTTAHGALSDEDDNTYLATNGTGYGTLATVQDPTIHTGHVLRYRFFKSTGTGSPTIALYQGNPGAGGTLIASVLGATTSGAILESSYTLTTAEAAAITNYGQLYWYYSKTGGTSTCGIYEFWMEFPAAGPSPVSDSAVATDSAVVTGATLKAVSDSGAGSDGSAKTTSIFPALVTAGQIDANSDGVRKFDYTQNGVWWAIRMPDGQSIRFYRSTDQGATWTAQAGDINIAVALGHDNLTGASIFIDKDDYLHLAATTYVTGSGVYFSYWRFTPNGARTSYGSQVVIDYFFVGDYGGIDNPDIIAYKAIGGGWDIWACCAIRSGGYWYLYVIQFRLDSTGNYFDSSGYLDIGYLNNPFYGKLDFRHTATDPKAVQASTPSVYVVQFNGSWLLAPFLTKYRYSGGTWIQESYVNLDPTSQASGLGWAAYDGTRIVIGFNRTPGQVRETLPRIMERDEANTTTTTHNPSDPGDGAIEELAFNTDSAGNISYYVVGATSGRIRRNVYNRAAGSWSGWTLVSGPTATGLGALKALSGAAPPAFDPIIYFTDAVYFRNFGAVGLNVTDTGAASDQSVLDTHQLQVFDGGFSQDASSYANVLATRADSATGTDAIASVNAALARTDSAVASDTSSAPNLMFLADIAGGTDTAVVYMQLFIAVSDTGVGSDLGSQGLYVNVTDSGAGSETSAAGVLKPVTDSGVASDARTLLVVYFATETGTAVDTVVSVGVPPRTVTDSAVGIDTVFAAPIVPVTVSTRFGMFGFATQSQYGVEASPATYAMPLGMPEGSGVPAPVVSWAEHFPAKGSVGLQEVRRELVPWAGDFTVPAFTRPLPSLLRGLLGSESRVGTAHTQVPATDDIWFTFFSLRPGTSSEGYRDGLIEGLRFDFVSGEPVQLGIQAQGREPYYMSGPFNSMETADIRSGWLTYVGADVRLDWNTQTPTTRWECEGGSLSIRRPAFVQGNYRDMKPVAVTRGNLEIELQVELVHREISHYRYSAYGGLTTTPQLGTAYGSADITFFEPMNTNRYLRIVIPAIAWEVDAPQPLAHPEEGNITLQAVGHAIVPAVIGRTGSVISTVTDNGLVTVP
jgi:hypothetical protein